MLDVINECERQGPDIQEGMIIALHISMYDITILMTSNVLCDNKIYKEINARLFRVSVSKLKGEKKELLNNLQILML